MLSLSINVIVFFSGHEFNDNFGLYNQADKHLSSRVVIVCGTYDMILIF